MILRDLQTTCFETASIEVGADDLAEDGDFIAGYGPRSDLTS